MKLLPRHVSQQFQRNLRQHVFASEVMVKIQRIRECFQGTTLPLPTPEVIAAWDDLPNVTVEVLPMSMRTDMEFLLAPPPTPTGFVFGADDASSHLSFNDCHYGSGDFEDHADTSALNEGTFGVVQGPGTRQDDQMSPGSHHVLDHQNHEEELSQSIGSPSLSSDPESFSSSGSGGLDTPGGFCHMVNQWMLDHRARGAEAFVRSLTEFGTVSSGCGPLAARIARVIVRKVTSGSYTEGKSLEHSLRLSALEEFKNCWEWNDTWTDMPPDASPTPRAINIASFIGCLYDAGVFNARDVHLCLSLLLEGEKRYDRLCAIHALLVQANDKLCKARNLQALMQFKDEITSRSGESGEFLWAATPRSRTLLTDILTTIERWMVSQALKRDQYRRVLGNRTIRKSAAGPRLRADDHVGIEPLIVQVAD